MNRIIVITLVLAAFAAPAFAGIGDIIGSAKSWLGGNAVALIISAILAIGGIGVVVGRFTPLLGAVGLLLVTVENVLQDNKLTRDEVMELRAKIQGIIAAAKKAKNG